MRISIETTLLADPSLALGRVGPSRLSLNGQQIIDEAEFFRAAMPTYFTRGSAGVVLQFSVQRFFSTIKKAEAFALLHFGAIPLSGLVTCICGESGDQQTIYLRNAVVESVPVSHSGTVVTVQYTIKGGAFEGDIPPEEIPGDPDTGESFITMRRGKVAIAANATSVVVTFSSPLSSVPVVLPHVSRPAGGAEIGCTLDEDSVTVNGFTVQLDGPTPDNTYKLNYTAIE